MTGLAGGAGQSGTGMFMLGLRLATAQPLESLLDALRQRDLHLVQHVGHIGIAGILGRLAKGCISWRGGAVFACDARRSRRR